MSKSLQSAFSSCHQMSSTTFKISGKRLQASTLTNCRQSPYIHQVARGSSYTKCIPSSKDGFLIRATHKSPAKSSQMRNAAMSPHPSCTSLINSTASRAPYSTSTSATNPTIHNVFDTMSGTWQYIIADPETLAAVIIDPVLNFDPATQAITTQSADSLLSLIKEQNYKIDKILETHAHADHLSAASYLQTRLLKNQIHKPPICIGKRIEKVQRLFSQRYGVPEKEYKQVFDRLFEDDETFTIGNMAAKAIHLPGHTPDHLGYMIGDNLFCGDSLFHADIGTARCDFPGGDAKDLFQSGRKLLSLPGHVKIWTGHDYPPEGRSSPVAWMTVQDHRMLNKHLKDGMSEDEFVALRKQRDAGLAAPKLLHQSLQINIRAGRLPIPTEGGHRLLHVPLKVQDNQW